MSEPSQLLSAGCAITEFPRTLSEMSPEMRQLELQTFEIAFESALEQLAAGITLDVFCREYHVRLWPGRFRAWIYKNPQRKRAFEVAEALWADSVADELIRIADGILEDGTPSSNDVQRSSLMINTRRYRMGVANRAKYGDVKKIEQTTTTTIDVASMSMDDLKRYVLEQAGVDPSSLLFENGDDEPV